MKLSRRQFSGLIGALAGMAIMPVFGREADAFAAIEQRVGGRLGVSVIDMQTGHHVSHRGRERFAMCSTFKVLACSAVLARVDAGQDSLERRVVFSKDQMVTYSPVTARHADQPLGMRMADICEAAMTQSDNTAANIIIDSLDGPRGVTAFARSIGDTKSRLDRHETELNTAIPGDARDTTTPDAMAHSLKTLFMSDALSPASRDQLAAWMMANKTGDHRLRAGLPSIVRVGDKTGSGDRGTSNDVGVIWAPGRRPVFVAAYLTGSPAAPKVRDKALADIGQIVAGMLAG